MIINQYSDFQVYLIKKVILRGIYDITFNMAYTVWND